MRYECPACHSFRKPRVIKLFPPIVVECPDCCFSGSERSFIKYDDDLQGLPMPHFH